MNDALMHSICRLFCMVGSSRFDAVVVAEVLWVILDELDFREFSRCK